MDDELTKLREAVLILALKHPEVLDEIRELLDT